MLLDKYITTINEKGAKMKTVKTVYTPKTADLGNYLRKRILKAKNILNVFKKLKSDNYNIVVSDDEFCKEKCKKAVINGFFNGIIHTITVYYTEKTDCMEDGFKQYIYGIVY